MPQNMGRNGQEYTWRTMDERSPLTAKRRYLLLRYISWLLCTVPCADPGNPVGIEDIALVLLSTAIQTNSYRSITYSRK